MRTCSCIRSESGATADHPPRCTIAVPAISFPSFSSVLFIPFFFSHLTRVFYITIANPISIPQLSFLYTYSTPRLATPRPRIFYFPSRIDRDRSSRVSFNGERERREGNRNARERRRKGNETTHLGRVGYPLEAKTTRYAPSDNIELGLVDYAPRRRCSILFSENILVDVLETGEAVEVVLVARTGSRERHGRRDRHEKRHRHRHQRRYPE